MSQRVLETQICDKPVRGGTRESPDTVSVPGIQGLDGCLQRVLNYYFLMNIEYTEEVCYRSAVGGSLTRPEKDPQRCPL